MLPRVPVNRLEAVPKSRVAHPKLPAMGVVVCRTATPFAEPQGRAIQSPNPGPRNGISRSTGGVHFLLYPNYPINMGIGRTVHYSRYGADADFVSSLAARRGARIASREQHSEEATEVTPWFGSAYVRDLTLARGGSR